MHRAHIHPGTGTQYVSCRTLQIVPQVFSPELSRSYGLQEFREDLKKLYK